MSFRDTPQCTLFQKDNMQHMLQNVCKRNLFPCNLSKITKNSFGNKNAAAYV